MKTMADYWAMDKYELVSLIMERDLEIKRLEFRVRSLNDVIFRQRVRIAAFVGTIKDFDKANSRGFLPLEFEEKIVKIRKEADKTVEMMIRK